MGLPEAEDDEPYDAFRRITEDDSIYNIPECDDEPVVSAKESE